MREGLSLFLFSLHHSRSFLFNLHLSFLLRSIGHTCFISNEEKRDTTKEKSKPKGRVSNRRLLISFINPWNPRRNLVVKSPVRLESRRAAVTDTETRDMANRGHLPAENNQSDTHAAYVTLRVTLHLQQYYACCVHAAQRLASLRLASLRFVVSWYDTMKNGIYDTLSQCIFL